VVHHDSSLGGANAYSPVLRCYVYSCLLLRQKHSFLRGGGLVKLSGDTKCWERLAFREFWCYSSFFLSPW